MPICEAFLAQAGLIGAADLYFCGQVRLAINVDADQVLGPISQLHDISALEIDDLAAQILHCGRRMVEYKPRYIIETRFEILSEVLRLCSGLRLHLLAVLALDSPAFVRLVDLDGL